MRMLLAGLIVAGVIPLLMALRANWRTSLSHAISWAIVAWLSWGVAFLVGSNFDMAEGQGIDPARYCALCLTGCAGVAVLGARRPYVGGWNLVVIGLFSVMILPLLESLVLGTHPVDGLRIVFMSGTIAIGILNYVPTRFAPVALLFLAACMGEIGLLYAPAWFARVGEGTVIGLHGVLAMTPWVGWLCMWKQASARSGRDRLWLTFRDCWGLFWAQRVREQFNQAAENAGWPVKLSWGGLVLTGANPPTPGDEAEILQTLRAAMQRFIASEPSAG
jgi:hypothetical protein